MNRVDAGGNYATFPSSWEEMDARQVRFAFRTFVSAESPLDFNFRMMFHFLGIRPHRLSEAAFSNMYIMCEQCLGFLLSEEGGALSLAYDSAINPLPRTGLLYGPKDLLQDLTFGEFRHAAMAVQTFSRSHEPGDLDELVGILYRRRSGRRNLAGRRASEPGTARAYRDMKLASHMKPWKKTLILAWFCACMKKLQTEKFYIDGEVVDLPRLFSGGDASGTECTWNDLAVQLARDNIVGNINDVDAQPLFSVLRILWSNYKEVKRYEKASKA